MANKRKTVADVSTAETQPVRKAYRSSVNGKRNRLNVRGKDPAFTYRIVNDNEDRILDMQERGYEIVTHKAEVGDKRVSTPKPEGSPVQISVGGGRKAYLMRIKNEWYQEDQAAKAAELDAGEEALLSAGEYGKLDLKQKTDGEGKPTASYKIVQK